MVAKFLLIFIVMTLSACMPTAERGTYHPSYPIPPSLSPIACNHGSIFQAGQHVSLYNDHIAHRVGDILTIRLEEATRGEKTAESKNDKNNKMQYDIPTLFGNLFPKLQIDTNSSIAFDGKGKSNQENKLRGTISVTVIQVLSNGNLLVQGESWITINEGTEFVSIKGLVRCEDISQDNTISSQRVAAAQITYSGTTPELDSARGGIFMKLLNRYAPY